MLKVSINQFAEIREISFYQTGHYQRKVPFPCSGQPLARLSSHRPHTAATPCTPPLSQLKTPPTHPRPSSCTLLRALPSTPHPRSAPSLTLITIGPPQHYEQEEGREQRRRWVAYLRARERRTFRVRRRVWAVWAERGTGSGSHQLAPKLHGGGCLCCMQFRRFPLARRSAARVCLQLTPGLDASSLVPRPFSSPTSLTTTPSSIDPTPPPITGPTSQPATGRSMSLGAVARSRTKWSRKMRVRSLSLRRAASAPRKCVRPCPPLPPLWPLSLSTLSS